MRAPRLAVSPRISVLVSLLVSLLAACAPSAEPGGGAGGDGAGGASGAGGAGGDGAGDAGAARAAQDGGSAPAVDAGSPEGSAPDGAPAGSDAAPGADASPAGDAAAPPVFGSFPGQSNNPVGYAAAPGYPGSLQPWTGGDEIATSGTAASPIVYAFYDFVPSAGSGTLISGSHLKFVGCRFQGHSLENQNVRTTGADITFEYVSVVPLVSIVQAPPHAAWPSAGAGLGLTGDGTGYQIGGNDGYEYGIAIDDGGPVTVDHADIWGFGNAITFMSTTAQMTVKNSWIHDAADAAAQQYHTDGPGYLNAGVAPKNIAIVGNTIASIGNTNALAFQAATTPYDALTIDGNYLSGFGVTVSVGEQTVGSTNLTFTNNVFGTDLPWVFGPIYGEATATFKAPTNVWKGNTLRVLAGTSPGPQSSFAWTPQDDGLFLWPDTTTHATDF